SGTKSLDVLLGCWSAQVIGNKMIPLEKLGNGATAPTFVSIASFNRSLNMFRDRTSRLRSSWLTHGRNPLEFEWRIRLRGRTESIAKRLTSHTLSTGEFD